MSELIFFSIPFFIVLVIVEAATSPPGRFEKKDTFASLSMGITNMVISIFTKGIAVALYAWLYAYKIFDLSVLGVWVWPLLFICEDFCYYWFHRAHHEVRFFWAAHVNHHSSEHYNLATALRQSWTTPLTGPIFWTPLAILGFDPSQILLAQAISLVYQFWIHTESIKTLGPLEWILNTPAHHRVHHGSDLLYLDRNHGGILIIWDRLFGTFQQETAHPHYGLIDNIHTFNPVKIAFHEWQSLAKDLRKTKNPLHWLRYIFGPPGWSHDGSKQTVSQMRAVHSVQHTDNTERAEK